MRKLKAIPSGFSSFDGCPVGVFIGLNNLQMRFEHHGDALICLGLLDVARDTILRQLQPEFHEKAKEPEPPAS